MVGDMIVDVNGLNWTWHWNSGLALAFLVAVAIYIRGWRHVRHSFIRPSPRLATIPNLLLFLGGLTLLALTLLSPLHALATQFFFMRVVQHLLLIAFIPCMLLVTNPLPVLFKGLPRSWRDTIMARLQGASRFQTKVCQLTAPGMVWVIFSSCVWLWYDPRIHQATLDYPWLHRLETLLLFAVALFYWWHITAAAPRLHRPLPPLTRIAYTAAGTWPVKAVGIVVLFTKTEIYDYPATFRLTGLVINDQSLGGIIGWVLGGIVFSATATVLLRQWLGSEDDKPPLPDYLWSTDAAMLAPGFKGQPE